MKREHRVISALHPTAVPVPRPAPLCEDEEVLGAPFYVMEFVVGTRTAPPSSSPRSARSAPGTRCSGLVDTLVELHAVDPAAVGLADFGRPEGFLDRQLRRWQAAGTPPGTVSSPGSTNCTPPSAVSCRTPPRPPSCTATTGSTTC